MTDSQQNDQNGSESMFVRAVLITLTVFVFLGLGGYAVYTTMNAKPDKVCAKFMGRKDRTVLAKGSFADGFQLKSIDDQSVDLTKTLREKRVLVEFFASWCPHCQASTAALKQIQQEYGDELAIVAINAGDGPDEPSTSLDFQKEYGITYPILDRPPETLMESYCLTGFPTFYLLDQEGRVVWNYIGTLEADSLAALKNELAQ